MLGITALLCDVDGCLVPSEEPAFVASADVTNDLLSRFGLPSKRTAEELRLATTGMNFRSTAVELVIDGGVPVEAALARGDSRAIVASEECIDGGHALTVAELQHWVDVERDRVSAYLSSVLEPDERVSGPLAELGRRYHLAAVSSSATARLDATFRATGLDVLVPAHLRFSAEDSLPEPRSKPDPAIYEYAAGALGIDPDHGIAVEDSVPGVTSAVAAGFAVIGNVMFVSDQERPERARKLDEAGAFTIVESWEQISAIMLDPSMNSVESR